MKNIKFIAFLTTFLLSYSLFAQDKVYTLVDEQPQFVGGKKAFSEYISKNLKYPNSALKMGIAGGVFVEFIVNKDGKISDMKIIRGIGGGCDEEAMRVIRNSPKWIPGKQRGRVVRVKMSIPIIFKIPEEPSHKTKKNEEGKEEDTPSNKKKFIFTKYVLLNGEEINEEILKEKVNPLKDLAYMYAIMETQKASKYYGKKLNDKEGVTLVYDKEGGNLSQILAKYGIRLETRRKETKLEVYLNYEATEAFPIIFATKKMSTNKELENMQFLEEETLKVGENKFTFDIEIEADTQGCFFIILEPMSKTNPNPGAMHFIRLKMN